MFLQNSPQFTPGNFEGHEVWELGVQGTATHNRGQCKMEGETLRLLWCLVLCRRTRWEVDSGVHPGDTAPDSGLVRKGSPGAVPGRGSQGRGGREGVTGQSGVLGPVFPPSRNLDIPRYSAVQQWGRGPPFPRLVCRVGELLQGHRDNLSPFGFDRCLEM